MSDIKFLLALLAFLLPMVASANGGPVGIAVLIYILIAVFVVVVLYAAVLLMRRRVVRTATAVTIIDSSRTHRNIIATLLFGLFFGLPFFGAVLDVSQEFEKFLNIYSDIFFGFVLAGIFATFLLGYSIHFIFWKRLSGENYFGTRVFSWALLLLVVGLVIATTYNSISCVYFEYPPSIFTPDGCVMLLKMLPF